MVRTILDPYMLFKLKVYNRVNFEMRLKVNNFTLLMPDMTRDIEDIYFFLRRILNIPNKIENATLQLSICMRKYWTKSIY